MKKKKIYFLSLFLFFLIKYNIYADNPSIFDYVPKTSGYLSLNDGFSVQIIGNGATYNVFNDINGQVDQIAWKANKEYVYIIVRLRGWNNENNAQYYLIEIDGRKTKAKGTAYLLSEIPDFPIWKIASILLANPLKYALCLLVILLSSFPSVTFKNIFKLNILYNIT
mgnify:CR=1 FL=1